MNLRRFAVSILAFLMVSSVMAAVVFAAVWSPSLPASDVTVEIVNLTSHEYPFSVELSDVDSGFDVSDGSYTAWCVDNEHNSERGVEHNFKLSSSYDGATSLPDEEWDMINYILNNKLGTGSDVQAAIWFFVNDRGYYWPTSPFTPSAETETMVVNAIAEGEDFTPDEGELLAVVADPTDGLSLQRMVIEIVVPGGVEPSPTPVSTPEPGTSPEPEGESLSTPEPGTSPEPEGESLSTPEPTLEPEDTDLDSSSDSGLLTIGLGVAIILVACAIGIGYLRQRRRNQ